MFTIFTGAPKIDSLQDTFKRLFIKKSRTQNVIVAGCFFSITRVLCSILACFQIGVIAHYLLPSDFGIWAIVLSFSSIFSIIFNFGVGPALQNKMSKLYAQKKDKESQVYFFSAYYSLCITSVMILGILFLIKNFIPWEAVFKTNDHNTIKTGSFLFLFFLATTMVSLPMGLSDKVFYSYQESWWSALFLLLMASLLLLSSIILVYIRCSFIVVVSSLCLVGLITSSCSFIIILLRRKWNFIAINLKTVWEKVKELLPESVPFLYIEIPTVILLFLDTSIVSKVTGLEGAGNYFIVKKLSFSFATLYLSLFAATWACYTEAVEQGDLLWAKKTLYSTGILTIAVYAIFIILFSLFGDYIVHLWTGKYINCPALYVLLGLWGFLYSWCSCFSIFLRATGNLKLQALLLTLGVITAIPLSLFLGNRYGILGICFAWIIASLPVAVSNPIQSFVFLKRNSKLHE